MTETGGSWRSSTPRPRRYSKRLGRNPGQEHRCVVGGSVGVGIALEVVETLEKAYLAVNMAGLTQDNLPHLARSVLRRAGFDTIESADALPTWALREDELGFRYLLKLARRRPPEPTSSARTAGMTAVAALIRRARTSAGYSQAELAERAGTSQPALARYETGATLPTLPTLERLLSACGRQLQLRAVPGN